ncbi:MAG: DUF2807 domain-containing protein [Sphingomonadaceae bacterium]|nr:MAG: DUF2807 domain-containing protein [Sphingomonadaceae bacterium]
MIKQSFIVLAALPLAGCFDIMEAREPGPMSEMSEAVTDFQRVSVGGAYAIVIQTGQEPSLSMEGPENMLAETEIVQEGDLLTIRPKDGNWNWKGDDGVEILMTVPMVNEVRVSGANEVSIDRVEGDSFEGRVSGAGEMRIADVDVEMLDLGISGAGDLEARGTAAMLKVGISGAGGFKGANLVAENADLRVSGAGSMDANVTGTADASVSGAGSINITGGATCNSSTSGAGSVNCQ